MIVNRALYSAAGSPTRSSSCCPLGAALFGLVWLAFILGALLTERRRGAVAALCSPRSTPPPGSKGGLANAIFGSVMMSMVAVLVGTPIGIFAGTYLAEYARHGRLAFVVRFVNDILLSAPSIVIGLFIYELVVVPMGHFSGWAGAAALTVIVIPVVVRTTENMLLLVPNGLREAATALGAPQSFVIKLRDLEGGPGRHHHRRAAGGGAHLRRNRAAAVHRAGQQPVLDHRSQRADGEPAGGDLRVRHWRPMKTGTTSPGPARC